jgi:hypothetical protein
MNIDTILTIIGMATLVNLVHEAPLYHKVLDYFGIHFKPFSCVMCSTFWLTFGFTVIPHGLESIFIASIAAITAELINIQIHKI